MREERRDRQNGLNNSVEKVTHVTCYRNGKGAGQIGAV